jgi:hypothetical protein
MPENGGHFLGEFAQNCEKRLLALSYMFARPSVRMEKLGSPLDGLSQNFIFDYF